MVVKAYRAAWPNTQAVETRDTRLHIRKLFGRIIDGHRVAVALCGKPIVARRPITVDEDSDRICPRCRVLADQDPGLAATG